MSEIRPVKFPTLEEVQLISDAVRKATAEKTGKGEFPKVHPGVKANRTKSTTVANSVMSENIKVEKQRSLDSSKKTTLKLYHPQRTKVTVDRKLGQFIDIKI